MKKFFLKAIRFYQKTQFFHLAVFQALFMSDKACRFQPSCSEYTYQAIEKYDIIRGSFLGIKRILRCHPWSKGGQDPLK